MSTKMPNTKAETWGKADVDGVYWWRLNRDDLAPDPVAVRGGIFYDFGEPEPTSVSVGEFLGPITVADTAALVALRIAAQDALGELENNERWWNEEGALQSEQNAFNKHTCEARGASNKECADTLRAALKEEKYK